MCSKKKPLSDTSIKVTLDDGFSPNNRSALFLTKLEGVATTSLSRNSLKDHVSFHERFHKEKFEAFLRLLSSLGYTEIQVNPVCRNACSIPAPTRLAVTVGGHLVLVVVWIIGISLDWGILFNMLFCLAPMIWMLVNLMLGIMVFRRELTFIMS